MSIWKSIKDSFARKNARRITKVYPSKILNTMIDGVQVEYAMWTNPLCPKCDLEQKQVNFYRKYINKGDFAVDIGANFGDTTLPMGLATGKEGLTLAFEPNPLVYQILLDNSKLNTEITNIKAINKAITKEPDKFYYISTDAAFTNGGLSKTKKSIHGKYVYPDMLEGIILEDFLEGNYKKLIDKLTFIKTDCEGMDLAILNNIASLIDKYKPTIVSELFEYIEKKNHYDMLDFFLKYGYKVYFFRNFDENEKLIPIKAHADLDAIVTGNMIAIQE